MKLIYERTLLSYRIGVCYRGMGYFLDWVPDRAIRYRKWCPLEVLIMRVRR